MSEFAPVATALVVVALLALAFTLWISAPRRTSKRKRLTRTIRRRIGWRRSATPAP
jgi:HAMP domain-containing protein